MDASIYWAWYNWIPSIGSVASLWTLWYCWDHRHMFKRLRYAYLAVGACVVGRYSLNALSMLILERNKYGSALYEAWIVPVLLAVFISLLGLVALGFALFWSSKWYRFRKIFGEAPPSSNDECKRKKEMVDNRLRWLARWMRQMFDFENTLLREVSKESEVGSEKHQELEETRRWVATAKKRFWLAQNLADFHGFLVHPSYKDYLSAKSDDDSPVLRRV